MDVARVLIVYYLFACFNYALSGGVVRNNIQIAIQINGASQVDFIRKELGHQGLVYITEVNY